MRRGCFRLKQRRYISIWQPKCRVAPGANAMTRGAIEWSLKRHTHDGSSGLRRFERRGGQFTRDPIEQPGEVGVGQATARDHVAGVNDTGVIARERHTDTRKRGPPGAAVPSIRRPPSRG